MTSMPTRARLLVALPLVLAAGCASASAETPASAPAPAQTSAPAAGHGSEHAAASTGTAAGASQPSGAATMVCGEEVQQAVATILALPAPPHSVSSWRPPVFSCTYHLARGPLVLTVTEAGTPAAAAQRFAELRTEQGTTSPLRGLDSLGLPAFESDRGVVAFVKDDKTLVVDPTGLPDVVNDQGRTRGDLAYTVATDVLGCWREH